MALSKFKKYLLALILATSYAVSAEIIEVDSLEKITQDFQENYNKNYLPQDLLVVIDLDKLLFKPFFLPENEDNKDALASLAPTLYKLNSNSKSIYLNQILLTEYKQELQDPDFPKFVKKLNDNKIAIIAVNNGFTGNFNNIPKFEIWFADYLKKNFAIDFSHSFINNNYIIFNNFKNFANTYPIFYKGILTSNNVPLAELIMNFLLQTNFIPKTFIMISSNAVLLNSMKEQLNNYSSSIVFMGYHYTNQKSQNNYMNSTSITKFLNELTSKMNKLRRDNPKIKTNSKKNNNPYDQNK